MPETIARLKTPLSRQPGANAPDSKSPFSNNRRCLSSTGKYAGRGVGVQVAGGVGVSVGVGVAVSVGVELGVSVGGGTVSKTVGSSVSVIVAVGVRVRVRVGVRVLARSSACDPAEAIGSPATPAMADRKHRATPIIAHLGSVCYSLSPAD